MVSFGLRFNWCLGLNYTGNKHVLSGPIYTLLTSRKSWDCLQPQVPTIRFGFIMEILEKWVYDLPATPPKTRTKPMRVLALGLSRSGTESLQRGLRMLGYNHVYHGFDMVSGPDEWRKWTILGRRKHGTHSAAKDGDSGLTRDDFDALLGHCEAVTDQPCALFARELIRAYPKALVVLNHRDVHSWYSSICNVFTPLSTGLLYHVLFWFNANLYWENRYAKECFQEYFHGSFRQHGKWVYEEHCAKVRGLVPPGRLLEWNVQDGWEPLCK